MPSALIPFCSFGSTLKGKHSQNISLRVCHLFDPVVRDGKLCYQMDMTKKMPNENTVQGEGLTLIIDANIEKSVAKEVKREVKTNLEGFDLRESPVETKKLVGVNIGTLAPYSAFGPGNYILTSVKQMSATEGFLSMSEKKRECEKETLESCEARLFEERVKKCGCTPQSLLPALQDQTKVQYQKIYDGSILPNFRQLYAPKMVLTATRDITRALLLCVLLPAKESMLMFTIGLDA